MRLLVIAWPEDMVQQSEGESCVRLLVGDSMPSADPTASAALRPLPSAMPFLHCQTPTIP